jgi:hypothetical protein
MALQQGGAIRSNLSVRSVSAATPMAGVIFRHTDGLRCYPSCLRAVETGLFRSHLRRSGGGVMIQQLRIYEIFENNKAAFHARFRDHAARIMRIIRRRRGRASCWRPDRNKETKSGAWPGHGALLAMTSVTNSTRRANQF